MENEPVNTPGITPLFQCFGAEPTTPWTANTEQYSTWAARGGAVTYMSLENDRG